MKNASVTYHTTVNIAMVLAGYSQIGQRFMLHITSDDLGGWTPDIQAAYSQAPSFEKKVTLVNNLPVPLGIACRDGMKFDLPPNNDINAPALVVKVDIYVSGRVKDSILSSIAETGVENSPQLKLVKNQWDRSPGETRARVMSGDHVRIEHRISMDVLKKHGGTVYVEDLDQVVSLQGCRTIKYHPFSREARLHRVLEETNTVLGGIKSANFIYYVKLIDNLDRIGRRFFKIGEHVMTVEPEKSKDEPDGFYIVHNRPVETGAQKNEVICDYYKDEDEVPFFKLHKTWQSAENDAHADEIRQANLKMTEFEARMTEASNKLKTAELNAERASVEAEQYKATIAHNEHKFSHERRMLQLEIDRFREEQRTIKERDVADAAATSRKVTVEGVKSIPALILGVLAIVTALQKAQAK